MRILQKSSRDKPKWEVVHVNFLRKFPKQINLSELRSFAKPGGVLEKMQTLVQSRLSVSSVQPKEWKFIMGRVDEDEDKQEIDDHDSIDATGQAKDQSSVVQSNGATAHLGDGVAAIQDQLAISGIAG